MIFLSDITGIEEATKEIFTQQFYENFKLWAIIITVLGFFMIFIMLTNRNQNLVISNLEKEIEISKKENEKIKEDINFLKTAILLKDRTSEFSNDKRDD
jgi:cell division protein FtsB